jgi:hypothetical protein
VPHWRDDRGCSAIAEPLAQDIAVIAFVRDELARCGQGGDTLLCDRDIRDVSGGYDEGPGSSPGVAERMDLGGAAAAGTADTMGQSPPFAPPAVR